MIKVQPLKAALVNMSIRRVESVITHTLKEMKVNLKEYNTFNVMNLNLNEVSYRFTKSKSFLSLKQRSLKSSVLMMKEMPSLKIRKIVQDAIKIKIISDR